MDRFKNAMRWMQFAMLFTGFGLCWIGFRAIDDKISYDAVSHEKISMLHMLGILLAICTVVWMVAWLAYRAICMMRNNQDMFPSSPNKPR